MIKAAAVAALFALAACSDDAAQTAASPRPGGDAQATAPAPPSPPPAAARLVDDESELLDFTYGWPAEAAAIPKLRARFEADLGERRTESLAFAREDKAGRGEDIPFNGHYFSKTWQTYGDGGRLLSLAAEIGTFTGGAHGNALWETILWDRSAGKEIEVAALFTDPARAFAAMTPAYCRSLDAQRAEKRGETTPLTGPEWMVQCRPLAEAVIAPVDGNRDGRFELFRVLIAPYEAGPYAEGSYEVDIPVTDAVRALLHPGFGGSF